VEVISAAGNLYYVWKNTASITYETQCMSQCVLLYLFKDVHSHTSY